MHHDLSKQEKVFVPFDSVILCQCAFVRARLLLALLVGLLAWSYGYSLNQDNSLLSEQLE